jgi:hypothetical protein
MVFFIPIVSGQKILTSEKMDGCEPGLHPYPGYQGTNISISSPARALWARFFGYDA